MCFFFFFALFSQIDGSTLKTLCMQHGPLNNFHLFLNHGIALAKYNTRDEASKVSSLDTFLYSDYSVFHSTTLGFVFSLILGVLLSMKSQAITDYRPMTDVEKGPSGYSRNIETIIRRVRFLFPSPLLRC